MTWIGMFSVNVCQELFKWRWRVWRPKEECLIWGELWSQHWHVVRSILMSGWAEQMTSLGFWWPISSLTVLHRGVTVINTRHWKLKSGGNLDQSPAGRRTLKQNGKILLHIISFSVCWSHCYGCSHLTCAVHLIEKRESPLKLESPLNIDIEQIKRCFYFLKRGAAHHLQVSSPGLYSGL